MDLRFVYVLKRHAEVGPKWGSRTVWGMCWKDMLKLVQNEVPGQSIRVISSGIKKTMKLELLNWEKVSSFINLSILIIANINIFG